MGGSGMGGGGMTDDWTDQLYVQNPKITARDMGDAVFLANPEDGTVLHLNATGAALWRLLEEPTSMQQAATDLQIAFPDVPREQIEDDVEDLFDNLVDEGLVTWRD